MEELKVRRESWLNMLLSVDRKIEASEDAKAIGVIYGIDLTLEARVED